MTIQQFLQELTRYATEVGRFLLHPSQGVAIVVMTVVFLVLAIIYTEYEVLFGSFREFLQAMSFVLCLLVLTIALAFLCVKFNLPKQMLFPPIIQ